MPEKSFQQFDAEHPLTDTAPVAAEAPLNEDAAPIDAAPSDKLRAFEDKHFGTDAVRLLGRVERGFGSLYKAMKPKARAHHEALEKLVETDAAVATARTTLSQAEATHADASAKVEATGKDLDAAPAE